MSEFQHQPGADLIHRHLAQATQSEGINDGQLPACVVGDAETEGGVEHRRPDLRRWQSGVHVRDIHSQPVVTAPHQRQLAHILRGRRSAAALAGGGLPLGQEGVPAAGVGDGRQPVSRSIAPASSTLNSAASRKTVNTVAVPRTGEDSVRASCRGRVGVPDLAAEKAISA